MTEELSFGQLIDQIRDGDGESAAELLRRYEQDLRVLARVRLSDPLLRRAMDSMDICQSVLCNFFVRVASGQFDLETPEQLLKLLSTMVRNKVIDHTRRQHSDRRDVRRLKSASVEELKLRGDVETPSQLVAGKELLSQFYSRMTTEERNLSDQRKQGHSWGEIAKNNSERPESLRKRLSRAIDRIAAEMNLHESDFW